MRRVCTSTSVVHGSVQIVTTLKIIQRTPTPLFETMIGESCAKKIFILLNNYDKCPDDCPRRSIEAVCAFA